MEFSQAPSISFHPSPLIRRPDYSALREALPQLDFENDRRILPELVDYRSFYHLNFPQAAATGVGTFTAAGFDLVAQYWLAQDARGTLFVCHGYFDHTGIYGAAVRFGLERGLNVVIFDMPGHGISSGEPVAIDTFLQYRQCFEVLLRIAEGRLPGPWHALGQSTGGATILNFLQFGDWQPFDKIMLLAPLVRPAGWHWRKWIYHLGRFLIPQPSRGFNINTHDAEFARRQAHRDPLQSPVISMRWLGAMVDWLQVFPDLPRNWAPLLVVQGTGDGTVDWRYNMHAIADRFPNSKRVIIEGARHQMINETQPYRQEILDAMDRWLND
ncbi:alpha/beta hydrolase [Biformimicrobium ophioploci]|uniref:Alpha/beta hydrolase n=1 Tax=Biformimicrobium ophioploci TaxID=3036711 RepID=A0ABQ6M0F0_9GAMM|nr:alpha/beta hydrolase [Microbulbifer sp. NKW57]GMG87801.1 alpha/beta hydrolase [Microbulbifer sp. NKW57]